MNQIIYDLDIEGIDLIIKLLETSKRHFTTDKTDYQKDLVLAKRGIEFLLDEYAQKLEEVRTK